MLFKSCEKCNQVYCIAWKKKTPICTCFCRSLLHHGPPQRGTQHQGFLVPSFICSCAYVAEELVTRASGRGPAPREQRAAAAASRAHRGPLASHPCSERCGMTSMNTAPVLAGCNVTTACVDLDKEIHHSTGVTVGLLSLFPKVEQEAR